jgi:hypothetical protein
MCLALVGCGSNSAEATTKAALDRWDNNHPPYYTYMLQVGGGFGGVSTSRVAVEGETVIKATDMDTNMPTFDARTMGELIQDVLALTVEAASIEVVFDPTVGYLKSVDGKMQANATDDEFYETVVCFEQNTSDQSCTTIPK